MHVVNINKGANIVLRAFTHIILFRFVLRTLPSKCDDPLPILLHSHLQQEAVETETQHDRSRRPQE